MVIVTRIRVLNVIISVVTMAIILVVMLANNGSKNNSKSYCHHKNSNRSSTENSNDESNCRSGNHKEENGRISLLNLHTPTKYGNPTKRQRLQVVIACIGFLSLSLSSVCLSASLASWFPALSFLFLSLALCLFLALSFLLFTLSLSLTQARLHGHNVTWLDS